MSDVASGNQGDRQGYRWLETWGYPLAVGQVVRECPEIVRGRRVVVTASDAGSLVLSETETRLGWTLQEGYAVSPVIEDVEGLPSTDLYDEWYVFDGVPPLGILDVYVTFTQSFFLSDKRATTENCKKLLESFWQQIQALRPQAYLACNENAFLFVCLDAELFERVAAACRRLMSRTTSIFSPD